MRVARGVAFRITKRMKYLSIEVEVPAQEGVSETGETGETLSTDSSLRFESLRTPEGEHNTLQIQIAIGDELIIVNRSDLLEALRICTRNRAR